MSYVANLVRETATTAGTGSFTVAAITGWRRASDVFGTSGAKFLYTIRHAAAAEYEIGFGHMSDANTLVRDEVRESSNSNALVSFAAGDKDVMCSATAAWIGESARRPVPGNLGYDEEFDRDGATSIPSGWSWVNQSTSAYLEKYGAGGFKIPTAGAHSFRMIVRSLSGFPSTWVATYELSALVPQTDFSQASIVLRESGTSKIVTMGVIAGGSTIGNAATRTQSWTNETTFDANIGGGNTFFRHRSFVRLTKNSSTSWDFEISPTGEGQWYPVDMARNLTSYFTTAPDQIGFGATSSGSVVVLVNCHSFRVR